MLQAAQPSPLDGAAQAARHFLVPWSRQKTACKGPVFVHGDGPWLVDDRDRRTFDLSSGWVAANLGHSTPTITAAMAAQAERIAHAPPIFANEVRNRLCRDLSRLSPWDEGARAHLVTGGGEAMDDALKVARLLTGRPKVMAAYRSYHGTTLGASGVTGDKRRWPNEPAAASSIRFFAPYPYRSPFHAQTGTEETERAIDHLERIAVQEGGHSIAALVIEPVVGSSGLIVYPENYLSELRKFADRHGIMLIFDEVMTGFGRVGEAFAATRFGVRPDMIVFGKGVNGGVLPLGGVLIREGLASRFDEELLFDAGHTHAGHPVVAASGAAALALYEEKGLFSRAYAMEPVIRDALHSLQKDSPIIGDVRGVGAFWGVELVRDRAKKTPLDAWYAARPSFTEALLSNLLEEGVLAYCRYGIIMIAPPLVATDQEIGQAIARIGKVLERMSRDLDRSRKDRAA